FFCPCGFLSVCLRFFSSNGGTNSRVCSALFFVSVLLLTTVRELGMMEGVSLTDTASPLLSFLGGTLMDAVYDSVFSSWTVFSVLYEYNCEVVCSRNSISFLNEVARRHLLGSESCT